MTGNIALAQYARPVYKEAYLRYSFIICDDEGIASEHREESLSASHMQVSSAGRVEPEGYAPDSVKQAPDAGSENGKGK